MGHIVSEATKRLGKDGSVEVFKVEDSTAIKSCNSCRHSKTTRKPIRKVRQAPGPAAMGDLIHLDVWRPAPMETIDRREDYASFTDDHTRWSRLYLQRTKDATFDFYQAFEACLQV